MKNEQEIIDKYYDKIFSEVNSVTGDDLWDLAITITDIEGRTYMRSWHDRNKRLKEKEWE